MTGQSGDPVWEAIASIRVIRRFEDRATRGRPTSSGSCVPAAAQGAARICSAGRSSSAAIERISRRWPRSDRGPAISPARPWRSPSSRRTRGHRVRRCRSSSTSVARPRTWCSPRGSSGSEAFRRRSTSTISRGACSAIRTTSAASTSCRSATRRTRPISPGRRPRRAPRPRRDGPRGALVGRALPRPTATGTCATRSRSRRRASRRAPRHTPRAARTPPRRP